MRYKTILAVLNETSRTEQVLDAASWIARRQESHLIGLYVIPAAKIYPSGATMGMPTVFEGYRDSFKDKMKETRDRFEARLKADALKGEWRLVESIYSDIASSAIISSQGADLVIACQSGGISETGVEDDLAERLVMESGRPVLIIPRQGHFAPRGEGITEKAVVGINGTPEAARAMFDAVPLLGMVRETRLVWVDPQTEHNEAGDVSGAEEAGLLSRHGINAVADPMVTDGEEAGRALIMRANDLGADLLVMGAYAHSRLREIVLGGATRRVLQQMNIPVLMSH
jgi:nucleotide-binding universal stress UspA family protein